MNIFELYVKGLLNGSDDSDLIAILIAKNAEISSGDGDDSIYIGYAVNSTINSGAGKDSILVASSSGSTLIGGLGDDCMISVLGSAKMYGDQGDSVSQVPIFLFFNPSSFTTQNVVFTIPATGFGNDTMYGGTGDDLMCGDSGSIENQVIFQTASTGAGQQQTMQFELTGAQLVFGNDVIYGGGGNDRINGDADLTQGFVLAPGTTPGATAIANGVNAQATATFITNNNAFIFGHDHINAGDGNDIVNGDVSVVANEAAFGVATAKNGGQATSNFSTTNEFIIYGHDHISGGKGNDIVFGDGRDNSHNAVGGSAYADGAGSVAKVLDWVGFNLLPGLESHLPLITTLGNDVISGDAGNDTIYGDTKSYFNEAIGGTATALNGGTALSVYVVDGTIVTYGKDQLSGGDGNDKIVGDTLSTELVLTQGTAVGVGATVVTSIINFTQSMGDDNIFGGGGNDLILGDCLDYTLLDTTLSVSTVGGHLRVADHFNNSITFGNDLMSGGSGCDNFITSVALSTNNKLIAQGFDKITDFNVASDILTFVGTTMAILTAHTQFVYSGNDTVIKFDGGVGGSITLQNVNVSCLGDLNITTLADSSTLSGQFTG